MTHNVIPSDIAVRRAQLWAELEMLGDPRTIPNPEDNAILDTDSYKLCHQAMYGRLGVTAAFSYIEPRIVDTEMMFAGFQIWLKRFKPITNKMVDQAKEFFTNHIIGGGEMFPESDWRRVVEEFGGYPPLKIRALPEGTVLQSRNAMVTIECDIPELAWMAAYFETAILRAVWYPVTVATRSRSVREALRHYVRLSSDLAVEEAVAFMFHDFGARGVSSKESAGVGGAAHILAGSMGTDTITGALYANQYYNGGQMSAFSVFATEHSIMTMRGREGELDTVRDLLKEYNKGAGTIISIVSDGYDIFNLAREYVKMKDEIVASGIRLVVRPDSGDPVDVILQLLKIFDEGFGSVVNNKGYKVLNTVRILQGDGLSTLGDFTRIGGAVLNAGFSIENMVFGQGGGLLQQVNRDTYKFAMKTCAARVNGEWVRVFKDPVTDAGKRSKSGKLTVVQNNETGEITTVEYTGDAWTPVEGFTELMQDVWFAGVLYNEQTLEQVKARSIIN